MKREQKTTHEWDINLGSSRQKPYSIFQNERKSCSVWGNCSEEESLETWYNTYTEEIITKVWSTHQFAIQRRSGNVLIQFSLANILGWTAAWAGSPAWYREAGGRRVWYRRHVPILLPRSCSGDQLVPPVLCPLAGIPKGGNAFSKWV